MGAPLCGASFVIACIAYRCARESKYLDGCFFGGGAFLVSLVLTSILGGKALIGCGLGWTLFSLYLTRERSFFDFKSKGNEYKNLAALLERTDIVIT